jgi:GT2 family glycosyltransferase
MPKIADIIIPHHNAHGLLKNLLEIIDNSIFNIIIVSGSSFGINCNKGARIAETDKLIFLNDDTEPKMSDLIEIVKWLDYRDVVGSTQINGAGIKYFGIALGDEFYPYQDTKPDICLFPSGFCKGVRRSLWEKLGGYNELFKTGYEDVDFGFRLVENNATMVMLDLEIKHLESQSAGRHNHGPYNEQLLNSFWSAEVRKELIKKAGPLEILARQ